MEIKKFMINKVHQFLELNYERVETEEPEDNDDLMNYAKAIVETYLSDNTEELNEDEISMCEDAAEDCQRYLRFCSFSNHHKISDFC